MPAMPDPVETARAQQQVQDEAKAAEQRKMREDAAADAMAEEKRRARRTKARKNLLTSGDILGVEESFIGQRRKII